MLVCKQFDDKDRAVAGLGFGNLNEVSQSNHIHSSMQSDMVSGW